MDLETHRIFLNQYYGLSRHIYDFTRRYYLLGRNRCLDGLLSEQWQRLIEIGPGTGRNLRYLIQKRPEAMYGGVEASDKMLEHAKKRVSGVKFIRGFAEEIDYTQLLGDKPDRILLSYALSMIQNQDAAIENARRRLSASGEVIMVDFGDLKGLPRPIRMGLRQWLEWFHVTPISDEWLRASGAIVSHGPGRYYVIARWKPLSNKSQV